MDADDESEDSPLQTASGWRCNLSTIREICEDALNELPENADLLRSATHQEKDDTIRQLKEQISFLAKRILILHSSHEAMKDQLDWLTNAAQKDPGVSDHNSNITPVLPMITDVPDSDSGCAGNVSSTSTETAGSTSNENSQDDLLSVGEGGGESDIAEQSPPSVSFSAPINQQQQLLRQLVRVERTLGWELDYLRFAGRRCGESDFRRGSVRFCQHHSNYLVDLEMLVDKVDKSQQQQVITDEMLSRIEQFWSNAECLTFVRGCCSAGHADKFRGFVHGHIRYLRAYLEGVRDSLPFYNRHLDKILAGFSFLIDSHASEPAKKKAQVTWITPTKSQRDHRQSYHKAPAVQPEFRVHFYECTAVTTVIKLSSSVFSNSSQPSVNDSRLSSTHADKPQSFSFFHAASKQSNF